MELKIGDKVRFLNEVGGGVVVGFFGPDQVIVEQEDGFGFPCLRAECVVISGEGSVRAGDSSGVVSSTAPEIEPDRQQIFLAFAPEDSVNIERGKIKVYIINDSLYTLNLNMLSSQDRTKGYNLYLSAKIFAGERMLIDELKLEELPRIEHLHFQITSLKESGAFKVLPPVDRVVDLKLPKFYKPTSFTHSEALGCKAMSMELTQQEEIFEQIIEISKPKDLAPKSATSNNNNNNKIKQKSIEVDLHIDKLLETTAGMSSGDILEYQLDQMRQTIAKYKSNRGEKIVFIHGKGDGVLRSAIIKELKKLGLGDRHQEASFKRYGFGALLVTI
ncbi:MAG: DUF2027 domain-containing protein [Rikenellaceae bacterium]